MRLLTIILASAALLHAPAPRHYYRCERAQRAAEECRTVQNIALRYIRSQNTLCVDKDITGPDSFLKDLKALHINKGVFVDINSYGGDVNSFIDLTEYLRLYDYTIIVDRRCLSSCGQFVFLGSSHRFIVGDGDVLMHGIPYSNDEISALKIAPTMMAALRRVNERFRQFLEQNGIPNELLVGGGRSTGKVVAVNGEEMWEPSLSDYRSNGIVVHICSNSYP